MRLLTWNIRQGGGRRIPAQLDWIAKLAPDVICLQEVGLRAEEAVRAAGAWPHVHSAVKHTTTGPHRYGVLIASRFPLAPAASGMPKEWREKSATAFVAAPVPWKITTLHAPPGVTNGWAKIDVIKAATRTLRKGEGPRVLCGDLNTPQLELPDGRTVTWGERVLAAGDVETCAGYEEWRAGEWGLLRGLEPLGIRDLYREHDREAHRASSWFWRGNERMIGRRFDHAFGSVEIRPTRCEYRHDVREAGLSDHAPLLVEFEITSNQLAAPSSPFGRIIGR